VNGLGVISSGRSTWWRTLAAARGLGPLDSGETSKGPESQRRWNLFEGFAAIEHAGTDRSRRWLQR